MGSSSRLKENGPLRSGGRTPSSWWRRASACMRSSPSPSSSPARGAFSSSRARWRRRTCRSTSSSSLAASSTSTCTGCCRGVASTASPRARSVCTSAIRRRRRSASPLGPRSARCCRRRASPSSLRRRRRRARHHPPRRPRVAGARPRRDRRRRRARALARPLRLHGARGGGRRLHKKSREPSSFERAAGALEGLTYPSIVYEESGVKSGLAVRESGSRAALPAAFGEATLAVERLGWTGGPRPPPSTVRHLLAAQPPRRQRLDGRRRARRHPVGPHRRSRRDHCVGAVELARQGDGERHRRRRQRAPGAPRRRPLAQRGDALAERGGEPPAVRPHVDAAAVRGRRRRTRSRRRRPISSAAAALTGSASTPALSTFPKPPAGTPREEVRPPMQPMRGYQVGGSHLARRAAPRAARSPPAASGTCRRPPRAAASACRRCRAAASAPARRWACRSE